jgi:hypothetical protein
LLLLLLPLPSTDAQPLKLKLLLLQLLLQSCCLPDTGKQLGWINTAHSHAPLDCHQTQCTPGHCQATALRRPHAGGHAHPSTRKLGTSGEVAGQELYGWHIHKHHPVYSLLPHTPATSL